MDPQIEFYKAVFCQRGAEFEIPVFREISRYQYGQCLGDVLRGIWRFIPLVARFVKPVATKGVQTLLKFGSKAIKEGATVKNVIKSALIPTVVAVLIASRQRRL